MLYFLNLFLQMNTANTAAKVIMMRATNETGKATGAELLNLYIRDPGDADTFEVNKHNATDEILR